MVHLDLCLGARVNGTRTGSATSPPPTPAPSVKSAGTVWNSPTHSPPSRTSFGHNCRCWARPLPECTHAEPGFSPRMDSARLPRRTDHVVLRPSLLVTVTTDDVGPVSSTVTVGRFFGTGSLVVAVIVAPRVVAAIEQGPQGRVYGPWRSSLPGRHPMSSRTHSSSHCRCRRTR